MAVYISFAVLSALVLWAVIYARGPWALKLALICTVPAFGVVVWHTLESYKGWPIEGRPPEGRLVAELVDEPTWIYLWVIPGGKDQPRAYRIPYTRKEHEQAAAAEEALGHGVRVGVRNNAGRFEIYELPASLPPKGGP